MLRSFEVPPSRAEGLRRGATSARRVPAAADGANGLLARRAPATQDVAIADDPGVLEIRPSVVTSPRRQDIVVMAYAGAQFPSAPAVRCFASISFDRGRRWSEPVRLPTLSDTSDCGAPALAYSPDGRYLYAAYQDQRTTFTFLTPDTYRKDSDFDVVVSRSSDDGRTWSPAVLALDAAASSSTIECAPYPFNCVAIDWTLGSSYERPSLAAGGDTRDASSVYVVSTELPEGAFPVPSTIVRFARSMDRGVTWGGAQELDAGSRPTATTAEVVTQGPRVATGPRGELLVAWYHSRADGPRKDLFDIRVRRSGTRGQTWNPIVLAATGELETGLRLGSLPYKRWWTTMFPAAVIDRDGRAHVAYTQDPDPIAATPEEGDIRYVASPGPPYTNWSSPVDVNDDGLGRAQGFASLATRRHGRTTIVEAVWEDTRLAPDSAPGLNPSQARLSRYDVFHSRLVPASGSGWSGNLRVSDASSTQNTNATNDRTALTANDSGVVFAVWSDRRQKALPTDAGDDLFGSRIAP
jgi:hypothetical protein